MDFVRLFYYDNRRTLAITCNSGVYHCSGSSEPGTLILRLRFSSHGLHHVGSFH